MNNTIIFSNECTSGRYYKVNKLQYNNPIIWHHWPINNYIEFIKNFDNNAFIVVKDTKVVHNGYIK